jgi:hypothetical protein
MGVWSRESKQIKKSRMVFPRRPMINITATWEKRNWGDPE